jgi:hypothetical protein
MIDSNDPQDTNLRILYWQIWLSLETLSLLHAQMYHVIKRKDYLKMHWCRNQYMKYTSGIDIWTRGKSDGH